MILNSYSSSNGENSSPFACMTFCALRKSVDQCGSNGLPLTPNSIKILGRAQILRSIKHSNLCPYFDILRGKYERTVVVCEHIGFPLNECQLSFNEVVSVARDVLMALDYLHSNFMIHRNLTPQNILVHEGKAKLFNYGLYYMTGNGSDVMFPIGHPKYVAPEVLLSGPSATCSYKVDLWSLGIILVELFLGCDILSTNSVRSTFTKLFFYFKSNDVFFSVAEDTDSMDIYSALPVEAVELVNKLLAINPLNRCDTNELLGLSIFKMLPKKDDTNGCEPNNCEIGSQLYHFWQLSGGDVYSELRKEGLIRSKPPILSLPNLIMLEGIFYGQKKDESAMLDGRVIKLNLSNLMQRFQQLPFLCHYPLLEYVSELLPNEDPCDSSTLPLIIRERDTEYQYRRLVLYSRLLKAYPYKKDLLLKEARIDIPPLVRAEVWSALLGINFNYLEKYRLIDKETVMPTDRQIEVDIPRCHQYNELLSSVEGHRKFKRILKAWVINHPQYVYWQGLDSLCAPFLFLNFQDEARAFACLCKFIYKYLHDFFLKDNSAVIREYLAKFRHLIAFQDPHLANHLSDIGFTPELFAIPWYLTMFSHVFPIHKILHLWDSLLLGNASYPLYVGFAILQQLRSTLLISGFNECILLFSDLPEIDIENVVKDSITFYCSTPSSVTYRKHELPPHMVKSNSNLEMSGQSLSELQIELSPRICARELIDILQNNSVKSKLILLDIRDSHDYEKEYITGSFNHPLTDINTESNLSNGVGSSKLNISEISCLQNFRSKIIVVIHSDEKKASDFCNVLVRQNYPKVCFLHGGISVMKNSDFYCCEISSK